ncbi:hypothetical protein HS1genome_0709 [Sulfodiicoccus acidiphilus]|uniref:Uncharacterized protein n=1 Tax=Sulfodiicoccus acidiphilus TaxID=1670455 RepID=A0A348B2B8_9CREN|nr:hypothetical protein HS1genome_0709 [Sulfodiicoccus acidiphilus]GGT90296.1 hypothetical protein GCM10007116_05120 [Sulfodiicoccus acidiphilus]
MFKRIAEIFYTIYVTERVGFAYVSRERDRKGSQGIIEGQRRGLYDLGVTGRKNGGRRED